jgi:superoxide dismutase, Fe-Mn family
MQRSMVRILVALATVGFLGAVHYYQERKKDRGAVFVLPELPYAYYALEPFIDEETMKLHHDKHHQAYVDKLNETLKDHPKLRSKKITELLENLNGLPESLYEPVKNFGGGHANNSFFWQVMTPNSTKEPVGKIKVLITEHFGSFDAFKKQFSQVANAIFGSGWAWLVMSKDGEFQIMTTANQDSPLSEGLKPLLALDVWEHAYYLKYHNKRSDYIDAWWNVVNWNQVEKNFDQAALNIKA